MKLIRQALLLLCTLLSSVAHALPGNPTAYWNPNVSAPTLVDGAISSLPDVTGNGNTATQGTAANRPILSGASNEENLTLNSETVATSGWTGTGATLSAGVGNSPSVSNNFATITDTAASSAHRVQETTSATRVIAGLSYVTSWYVKAGTIGWAYIRTLADPSGVDQGFGWFNISTGAVGTLSIGTAINIEVDSILGWYKCSITWTALSTGLVFNRIGLASGDSNTSYLGTGSGTIYAAAPQIRKASTSSTYISTTTFPIYAGINGNRVPVFDGSNDSLTTSLAVNPTGGMWGVVVVRTAAIGVQQTILGGWVAGATARLWFRIGTAGRIDLLVANGDAAYIGRVTANSQIVAGTPAVVSFTYDGGTLASGLKIYKNGVQIDTTDANLGSYSVPTGGASLILGAVAAGTFWNGYLLPAAFGQGSTISDQNRIDIEQAFMYAYVTPRNQFNPIGQSAIKYPWQLPSIGSYFGALR